MDVLEYIINYSTEFISSGGILFGFFLVFLECFIPALPLSVFVTLNVKAFGLFLGVFISWIATSLGSFLCFSLFSYLGEKVSEKFLNRKMIKRIKKAIDKFSNISFSELVLIITLPFTPSFLVNIVSGLSHMSKEKFILALLIGKVFMVIFWGYIGKSLIDSLTDVNSLIYIVSALIVAYIISKIVSHKMNIE